MTLDCGFSHIVRTPFEFVGKTQDAGKRHIIRRGHNTNMLQPMMWKMKCFGGSNSVTEPGFSTGPSSRYVVPRTSVRPLLRIGAGPVRRGSSMHRALRQGDQFLARHAKSLRYPDAGRNATSAVASPSTFSAQAAAAVEAS